MKSKIGDTTNSEIILLDLIKWLESGINITAEQIKSVDNIIKNTPGEIEDMEKKLFQIIELFQNSLDKNEYKYQNISKQILKMQEKVTNFANILRENLTIVSAIYRQQKQCLNHMNIASKKICNLFGISSLSVPQ